MSELSYRYRAHPFARAQTFRLGATALIISDGVRERSVPYADVSFIEAADIRFLGSDTSFVQHSFRTQDKPVVMGAGFRDPWRVVDQRLAYDTFFSALRKAIFDARPDCQYVHGRLLLNRAGELGAKIAVGIFHLVGRTNPDRWANVAAWIMRRLGPRLRGHRRALEQIALAFPEKSPEERERIAIGMWENLARTFIEYAQIDTLWSYDPEHPERSRIIRTDASAKIWTDIKASNRRSLHFSLHIANWELCAIAGPQYGLKSLIPFRRLKNQTLTEELVRVRQATGITPLAVAPSILSDIRKEFGQGDAMGMLIDQHYVSGIEVTFFGRPTKFNPFFARLVRIYDCPVYGSRIIRRDDGRFGYEIVGPLEPARDARGRVDIHATTQQYISLLERWIREYPEQWLWLHRVWR